jgi:hypothetical protein
VAGVAPVLHVDSSFIERCHTTVAFEEKIAPVCIATCLSRNYYARSVNSASYLSERRHGHVYVPRSQFKTLLLGKRTVEPESKGQIMGVLTCDLFTNPPSDELERCANRDADHITPGASGDHVKRIQIALNTLSNVFLGIDGIYGPRTAAAVVVFKEAQSPPLRQPWESIADNIVGIRTIRALDRQMHDHDQPQPMTGLISTTPYGTPHDHNQCEPFLDSDDYQGKISHHGTPINPQGWGRMLCFGGTNEVKYLGFENVIPDPDLDGDFLPSWVLGRRKSNTLPDHCASDICFRSAPIDQYEQPEVKRLAMPGCRLTYASNAAAVASRMPFLLSLGPQIDSAYVNKEPNPNDPFDLDGLVFVVISMLNVR